MLKTHPGSEVAIIDRLPTPYGLVRSGVAPDHPETKVRPFISSPTWLNSFFFLGRILFLIKLSTGRMFETECD